MKWLEMPSGKGSVFSLLGLCNCDFALQWKKKKEAAKHLLLVPRLQVVGLGATAASNYTKKPCQIRCLVTPSASDDL